MRSLGRLHDGFWPTVILAIAFRLAAQMMQDWLNKSNVVLRGGVVDESPHCYKRLPEMLEARGGSIRVLHTLTPLGVAMTGANEFDPYKD